MVNACTASDMLIYWYGHVRLAAAVHYTSRVSYERDTPGKKA